MLKNYPPSKELDKLKKKIVAVNSLSDLFKDDETTREVVDTADAIGEYLALKVRLKTSQLRKIFDKLKNIEANVKSGKLGDKSLAKEAILLKPILVYTASKHPRTVGPLVELLSPAVEKIKNREDFDALIKLTETILAYHRYHGGKD